MLKLPTSYVCEVLTSIKAFVSTHSSLELTHMTLLAYDLPELPGEEVHTTQLIGKSVQLMFGFNARNASCVRPALVQMR